MSTVRGLYALDAVWTVRNSEQFQSICLRVCEENAGPNYSQFRKEFCFKVKRWNFVSWRSAMRMALAIALGPA